MIDVALGLLIWHAVGLMIIVLIKFKSKIIGGCTNTDFLYPVWIYKNCKVNWFGTIIVCLFFNILCPIISIGTWFYKLCTVGRK